MTCELKQARLEAHLLSVYAGRLFLTLRRALSDGRPLTPGLGIMAREFMPFGITIPTPDGPLKIEADPRIPGDVEAAQETFRQIFPQGMVMASSLGSGTAAALPPSRLMSKVAESFTQMAMADGERTKATISEYASVIREFIAKTGDLPIREVRGKHISDYRHFLLTERKLVQRTIDKKLNAINALFKQAQDDGDWDSKEEFPTVGHYKFKKAKRRHGQEAVDGYHAFTNDELKAIFSTEGFCKNLREPHEYWLPLLGLLSGGRINELCQLLVTDIKREGDVWLIDINAQGHEKKRLKTSAAQRKIPLHPLLIELGFLEYAELVRNLEPTAFEFPGLLFPYLSFTEKNGFGGAPSKKFGRLLDRIGIVGEKKVFHSFRNNLNQYLMNLKLHLEHRSRLMGHEFDHVNVENYSTDLPLAMLRDDYLVQLPLPEIDFLALKIKREKFQSMLEKLANMRRKQLAHEAIALERDAPVMRERKRIPSI